MKLTGTVPFKGSRLRRNYALPDFSHNQDERQNVDLQDERSIANVIILTGLSHTSDHVQIQALEVCPHLLPAPRG